MKKEIELLFLKILEDIKLIMNDNFYNEKESVIEIGEIVKKWYHDFTEEKTLTVINASDLNNVGLEITDLFDMYIKTESVTNNFTEQLLYDFSILEKMWKDEMLGGKDNAR